MQSRLAPRRYISRINLQERCHDVVPATGGRPVRVFLWEDHPGGGASLMAELEAARLTHAELEAARRAAIETK